MSHPTDPDKKPPEDEREAPEVESRPTREAAEDDVGATPPESESDAPTAGGAPPSQDATLQLSPEEIAKLTEHQLPTDPDDPLVGTLLRNKWRVLARIGAGSFGTVYKVQDKDGEWIEALKILSVDRLRGPEAENMRKRFLREARIMKRLGSLSPHIVGLSTYEDDIEAGLVYFLMEHVEGRILSEVLLQEGPLSVERATRIGLQVCDAMIAAHESDPPVVHRDLKLENLMLTTDREGGESIKVLDFGIAKLAEQDVDSRLTQAGTLGTPGYAAPEQLRAAEVDGRTDLFAFGVILYSLLTGKNPWLGHLAYQPTNQTYELMAASDRADVLPFEKSGVDVPEEMREIILKLLQREPEDRYQSARELRDALRAVAGVPVDQATAVLTQSLQPPKESTTPERRLAAVWFADLVGYSTLSSQDEELALQLLDIFHKTARREIEAGGGRVVQFIGDAAFAEFSSTQRAVKTAKDFMEAFAEDTAESGYTPQLRIGIHVGDVLMAPDGDLFGDGVNVAARIQNDAEPGQILVSQDVWRQLKQRRDFGFVSVGERSLKGIGAPVHLYALVEAGDVATTGDMAMPSGDPTTGQMPAYPQPTEETPAAKGGRSKVAAAVVLLLAVAGGGYAAVNAMGGGSTEPVGATSDPTVATPAGSEAAALDSGVVVADGGTGTQTDGDPEGETGVQAGGAEVDDAATDQGASGEQEAGGPPPPPQPEPAEDPWKKPYEDLLGSITATRDEAMRALHAALQARFDDAEGRWTLAQSAAGSQQYQSATSELRGAGTIYDEVIRDSGLLDRIDEGRAELNRLRGGANDAGLRGQAEAAEGRADRAVQARRYQDAIDELADATRLMAQAAAEPDPPPPPEVVPEEVAADVLRRLETAMEAEDLAGVREVWTSISAEQVAALEGLFPAVSDLNVTYDADPIRRSGDRVVATVHITYMFAEADDPLPAPTQIFEMAEAGGQWVIVASRVEGD